MNKCKDCSYFSDITVKCCELDGSEPCEPENDACEYFDPKDGEPK